MIDVLKIELNHLDMVRSRNIMLNAENRELKRDMDWILDHNELLRRSYNNYKK